MNGTYSIYGNCQYIQVPPPIQSPDLTLSVGKAEMCNNISSPNVWGDAFWFILHLGSCAATDSISPQDAQGYWSFIEGIPAMLPCKDCAKHAREYVLNHESQKNNICKSRDALIKFFVDFHNSVNRRTGKPEISVEEIKKKFRNGGQVAKIRYF